MRAALETSRRWEAQGHKVAAAILVTVGGSTPRRAGARLLVSSGGDTRGSVSFGCVEADVAIYAREVLQSGRPRLAQYGISDEDAFAVGFSCGGTMEVFIEPWAGLADRLGGIPDEAYLGTMATVLTGPNTGAHGLLDQDGCQVAGDLPRALAGAVATEAAAAANEEQARVVQHGESRVFLEPVVPAPQLLIFGAGHAAQALTPAAAATGFRVTVCDHRPGEAMPGRYPQAELLVGWPDEVMPSLAPDRRTYAVVLVHNPEIEDSLLPLLLATETRYIGVLGSRRTHAARIERLKAAGLDQGQLARLHAPVGLNIGAVTPEEIAVSIVAELVAERRRRPAEEKATGR